MKHETDVAEHLPLTPPVFHILLALADEERHGYAIIMEVARRTDGAVKLGSGTLYAAIKRLLQIGIIEETEDRPAPEADDERRRYYRITELGLLVAQAEVDRMAQLLTIAADKRLHSRVPTLGSRSK